MIAGLGLDVVEVPRIQRSWDKFGWHFAQKILHEDEQDLLKKLASNQVLFLASRFAAKEAAVKALGTGFSYGIGFLDICIKNLPSGQPELLLFNAALARMEEIGAIKAHISITHTKASAVAVVLLES